jgi:hypothetical protein
MGRKKANIFSLAMVACRVARFSHGGEFMPYHWPEDTVFTPVELNVEDRSCLVCGGTSKVCDHRHRRLFTFAGPLQVVSKLVHCSDKSCPGHAHTRSPEAETALAMPWWVIGWDVFCWLGHRRFARHWSVPQIRAELGDTYRITVSADAIEDYIDRYQCMLAARQQDAQVLAADYRGVKELVLAIDGLQPEKGHETLYVVREVTQKRVWFAEALVSSSAAEVRRLLVQAREWAERLGKPVRLWLSDKQDAFVSGIAAEFPGVPHRYCSNHFVRDLAKPMLEADSHAKVQMRRKVRGLRTIERQALQDQRCLAETQASVAAEAAGPEESPTPDSAANVVLEYCATVRGILNDDQGGPLHPPGLRMAEALAEVGESLQRNLEAKKGGARRRNSRAWPSVSTAVWPTSRRTRRKSAST